MVRAAGRGVYSYKFLGFYEYTYFPAISRLFTGRIHTYTSTKDFKKLVRPAPVPDKKTHVTDPVNFFIIYFKTCGALIGKP